MAQSTSAIQTVHRVSVSGKKQVAINPQLWKMAITRLNLEAK